MTNETGQCAPLEERFNQLRASRLLRQDYGAFGVGTAKSGSHKTALRPAEVARLKENWNHRFSRSLWKNSATKMKMSVMLFGRQIGSGRRPHSGTKNLAEPTGQNSDAHGTVLATLLQIFSPFRYSSKQPCDVFSGPFFMENFKNAMACTFISNRIQLNQQVILRVNTF